MKLKTNVDKTKSTCFYKNISHTLLFGYQRFNPTLKLYYLRPIFIKMKTNIVCTLMIHKKIQLQKYVTEISSLQVFGSN